MRSDRRAEHEPGRHDPPGERRREVVRSEVDTGRLCGEGDIDAIIDEQRHVEGLAEPARKGAKGPVIRALETELHCRDAASDRALAERHRIVAVEVAVVSDEEETERGR